MEQAQQGDKMRNITNWKKLLDEALSDNGESWGDVESNTLTDDEMELEFDSGYGRTRGKPFTVWTKNYVYFPWSYDRSEGVTSVSRNPDGKPTYHVGGG